MKIPCKYAIEIRTYHHEGDEIWIRVLVRRDAGKELGPVFFDPITAKEILDRVNAGEQFFRHIPEVPYGSPWPRPANMKVTVCQS